MIQWSLAQAAIHGWVTASTGVAAGRVYFADQSSPRLDGSAPYATIQIMSLRQLGHDGGTIDDTGDDPLFVLTGQREMDVRVQVYGVTGIGPLSPISRVESLAGSARLPTIAALFAEAGCALLSVDNMGYIGGALGDGQYEPRAIADCRFIVTAEVSEISSYIETVEGTNELTDTDFTITI